MTGNNDKKRSPVVKIVFVAILFLAAIVLFPRRKDLLDGGTVRYFSIGKGAVYEVECRHRLHPEDGKIYYEVGTIVYIFEKEIFNSVHVDYEHWSNEGHSPEAEEKSSEIESILNSED